MSDLSVYKDMLTKANISFSEERVDVETRSLRIIGGEEKIIKGELTLVGADITPASKEIRTYIRVDGGYSGFYSVHTFSEDGTLLSVESYE